MVDPREPVSSLTDRELLLIIYERCEAMKKCDIDMEARMRVVETYIQQSIGRMTAYGGGAGAIAATVVAIGLKLIGMIG